MQFDSVLDTRGIHLFSLRVHKSSHTCSILQLLWSELSFPPHCSFLYVPLIA